MSYDRTYKQTDKQRSYNLRPMKIILDIVLHLHPILFLR